MKEILAKFKGWSFNREARKRGEEVLKTLPISEGMFVADIGSGGGYFAAAFAKRVGPNGRVFAVDTDEKLLGTVIEYAEKEGTANVAPIHVPDGAAPDLPEQSLDLVFTRDAYHHIEMDHVKYFSNVKRLLKPRGLVAIIDYKIEGLHRIFGHATDPAVIKREMNAAGYSLAEEHDFLPTQSFLIFQPRV